MHMYAEMQELVLTGPVQKSAEPTTAESPFSPFVDIISESRKIQRRI